MTKPKFRRRGHRSHGLTNRSKLYSMLLPFPSCRSDFLRHHFRVSYEECHLKVRIILLVAEPPVPWARGGKYVKFCFMCRILNWKNSQGPVTWGSHIRASTMPRHYCLQQSLAFSPKRSSSRTPPIPIVGLTLCWKISHR